MSELTSFLVSEGVQGPETPLICHDDDTLSCPRIGWVRGRGQAESASSSFVDSFSFEPRLWAMGVASASLMQLEGKPFGLILSAHDCLAPRTHHGGGGMWRRRAVASCWTGNRKEHKERHSFAGLYPGAFLQKDPPPSFSTY